MTIFSNLKNQKTGEVEKPLKNALYNVGVLIILGALMGVFFVLLPFLNPLLWAFLVGALLFPAKKKLSVIINTWINRIDSEEVPVVVGFLAIPINILDNTGELITLWLLNHAKILLIGLASIISLQCLIYFVPAELFALFIDITMYFHQIFGRIVGLLPPSMVIVLVMSYVVTVVIMWQNETAKTFAIIGQIFWMFIVAYLCSFLGAVQIPVFFFVSIYCIIGLIYDESNQNNTDSLISKIGKKVFHAKEDNKKLIQQDEDAPAQLAPPHNEMEFPVTPVGRFMKTRSQLTEIKQRMQLNLHQDQQKQQQKTTKSSNETELESDAYFQILFYACLATIIWNHLWIAFLCFIPISFYSLKVFFKVLGLWSFFEDQWKNQYAKVVNDFIEPRKLALVPVWLPGVKQLNKKLHKIFCSKLKSFVDDISAIIMILFLIVAVVFVSIFFFFQIYSETITVAQLGSNLINRTLTHRPDLVEMLPINMQSMNDIIDNAYKYSRSSIEDYLDNIFNGTDVEQSVKLKAQILSVWDRLVQSYMDRNNEGVGPRVPSDSVLTTIDEIVTTSGGKNLLIIISHSSFKNHTNDIIVFY